MSLDEVRGDLHRVVKAPWRRGRVATARIDRHAFGLTWNAALDRDGAVIGDDVEIVIDAEAVMEAE